MAIGKLQAETKLAAIKKFKEMPLHLYQNNKLYHPVILNKNCIFNLSAFNLLLPACKTPISPDPSLVITTENPYETATISRSVKTKRVRVADDPRKEKKISAGWFK